MKHSLSDGSGFLQIDHKDSPGVDPSQLPPGFVTAGKGELLERDIQQCSHCQRTVVLNPGRVRARASCPKCYHYICDSCETVRVATGACVPFKQVLDRAADIIEKYSKQPDHPSAQVDVQQLSAPSEPKIVLTDSSDIPTKG